MIYNIKTVLIMVVVFYASSQSCVLPVFRYALERWMADRFVVTVYYDKSLSQPHQEVLDQLESAVRQDDFSSPKGTQIDSTPQANLHIRKIDVNQRITPDDKEILSNYKDFPKPVAVITAPGNSPKEQIVWAGELLKLPIENTLQSPIRKQVVDLLGTGTSVVWVYVKDANPVTEFFRFRRIKKMISDMEGKVSLPDISEAELPGWFDPEGGPALQIKFSTLSFSANDPQEQMFLKMLRPDNALPSEKQPVLFAISGRGRLFFSLTKDEITELNVLGHNAFLCGSCSCTIKADNPGRDLLISAAWSKYFPGRSDTYVDPMQKELPSIGGFWESIESEADNVEPVHQQQSSWDQSYSRSQSSIVFINRSSSSKDSEPSTPVEKSSRFSFLAFWLFIAVLGFAVVAVVLVVRLIKHK